MSAVYPLCPNSKRIEAKPQILWTHFHFPELNLSRLRLYANFLLLFSWPPSSSAHTFCAGFQTSQFCITSCGKISILAKSTFLFHWYECLSKFTTCAKGRAYLVRHEEGNNIYIRTFGNLSYLDMITWPTDGPFTLIYNDWSVKFNFYLQYEKIYLRIRPEHGGGLCILNL